VVVSGTAASAVAGVALFGDDDLRAQLGRPDSGHKPGDATPDTEHIALDKLFFHHEVSDPFMANMGLAGAL
jgi:hypothetical protein